MLRLSKHLARKVVQHALAEDPNECCGILAGTGETVRRAYRITNKAKSRYRYLMDPQQFLDADKDAEARGWKFLAFYHSHTHSEAYPSQTDVRMALESGWLDIHYVLVSLADKAKPVMRTFHIHEDKRITEDLLDIQKRRPAAEERPPPRRRARKLASKAKRRKARLSKSKHRHR